MSFFSPACVFYDYEPTKVKTSPQERRDRRRINKYKKLATKLGIYSMAKRIANGNESVKEVDEVLKRIVERGFCPAVIDAIKRKQ